MFSVFKVVAVFEIVVMALIDSETCCTQVRWLQSCKVWGLMIRLPDWQDVEDSLYSNKLARNCGNSLRHICYCISSAGVTVFVLLCSHRNVYVVVVPLRRARGVIRQLKSPDEMDLEEVRTTTMTAPTDVCAWKEERTYKHTHNPIAENSWQDLPFIIQYRCLNISHRYWNVSFFFLCLPSLCFSLSC